MSMRVSRDLLIKIADKMEMIDSLGVEVRSFVVEGHEVFLSSSTGQSSFVVGITDKVRQSFPEGGAHRNGIHG